MIHHDHTPGRYYYVLLRVHKTTVQNGVVVDMDLALGKVCIVSPRFQDL